MATVSNTTKQIIDTFNIVARTEYNQNYKEFEPQLKELAWTYNSGLTESVNFPFFGFFENMKEFTGSREFQSFPNGYYFPIVNKQYDNGVEIPLQDIERSQGASSSFGGLDIYKQRIGEMARQAKEHYIELALTMLEVGDANTYGTTFDGQNFFDTTHSYSDSAGTQDNIQTGTGTTLAQISADMYSALGKLAGFTYNQGGTTNAVKRKLNPTLNKLLVVCPTQLHSKFMQLKTESSISSSQDNPWRGMFDFVSRPQTDSNDWILITLDSRIFRPFLHQVEKPIEIDLPNPTDESIRNNKMVRYGAYGRYTVAYGAWWTAVQVTNTSGT